MQATLYPAFDKQPPELYAVAVAGQLPAQEA